MTIQERITAVNWAQVAEEMHQKGYAIISDFLSRVDCEELIANYDRKGSYRKTVVMERYRFGRIQILSISIARNDPTNSGKLVSKTCSNC